MHIPNRFQQNDANKLKGIIFNYPFATLLTHSSETGLDANHIPFVLSHSEGKNLLHAHIAKANPLWKNLKEHSEVMVVFNGPNCYVSANHYPTKKQHCKAVPTWNYITVHVKGKIRFIHDDQLNLKLINELTEQHEAGLAEPWSTSDAPEEFIRKMLAAIIGLEIEVQSITGQWKLSQNQPEQNRQGVITGLARSSNYSSQEIAELVSEYSQ